MTNKEEYKHQISPEFGEFDDNFPQEKPQEYKDFDDFTKRSSRHERHQLFSQSLHPDVIPLSEMEPELHHAIAHIKAKERHEISCEFWNQLQAKGLIDLHLDKQLGLSTDQPNLMSIDDVSKLASFTYINHPDIFQNVLADQPSILNFLCNPLFAAVLGVMSAIEK